MRTCTGPIAPAVLKYIFAFVHITCNAIVLGLIVYSDMFWQNMPWPVPNAKWPQ